jgi:pyruvate-formate lyase-activating enzyme
VRILLVATYELGQQPGPLGAAAAHLRAEGHDVRALDVSVDPWDPTLAGWADEVAFSVPMHTATRLARDLAQGLDRPVRVFGLYAAQCRDFATEVDWDAHGLDRAPDRSLLPPLERYARLAVDGEERLVGSVLTTHGCAHRCRHCPVPVVFDGRIRRVDEDAVLADVEQLVAVGARHITFGDPDFLNAPPHARRVVAALHRRHPEVTFDCTVKVEHVLRHADLWPELADAGCIFVVSAFESVDDAVLDRLDKGHTAADAARAVHVLRDVGIDVRPSWLPFTPWTMRADLVALLDFVHEHDLVGSVDPVQYGVRLLLPQRSLLLDHPDLAPFVGAWDPERSTYSWSSPDPELDALQLRIAALVDSEDDPVTLYPQVRELVGAPPVDLSQVTTGRPRLTESWFCCAEPTERQLASVLPWSAPVTLLPTRPTRRSGVE